MMGVTSPYHFSFAQGVFTCPRGDNELLCRLVCDILRTEGYHAVPASSASQALEAFEREGFDLLVTDFRMPGMSGLELARAIRDRNPEFPIIVMSVYEPVADRKSTRLNSSHPSISYAVFCLKKKTNGSH